MTMPASSLEVPLNYLVDHGTDLTVTPSTAAGQTAQTQGEFRCRSVILHDGRQMQSTLDRQGFTLVRHDPGILDFYDDSQVGQRYADSVRSLVKSVTGAARVEVFDHTRRAASPATRRRRQVREPASTIHNDYDAESGLKRLFALFPDEAEHLARKRFAIVNLWRSINGTVENYPLALCDASTVAADNLVSVRRDSGDRVGAIQMLTYSAAHRWFFFPAMRQNEALLFKVFDSAVDGVARFTPHTSFADPGAGSGAAERESIESRCFVFY